MKRYEFFRLCCINCEWQEFLGKRRMLSDIIPDYKHMNSSGEVLAFIAEHGWLVTAIEQGKGFNLYYCYRELP